jgi:hypothetical protein
MNPKLLQINHFISLALRQTPGPPGLRLDFTGWVEATLPPEVLPRAVFPAWQAVLDCFAANGNPEGIRDPEPAEFIEIEPAKPVKPNRKE